MRTKGDVIRNTRYTAGVLKNRSAVYRRIIEWKERDVGTEEEMHTIFLSEKWSFDPDIEIKVKNFSSVAEAMRGISLTYPTSRIKEEADYKEKLSKTKRFMEANRVELINTKKLLEESYEENNTINRLITALNEEIQESWTELEWANCRLEVKETDVNTLTALEKLILLANRKTGEGS